MLSYHCLCWFLGGTTISLLPYLYSSSIVIVIIQPLKNFNSFFFFSITGSPLWYFRSTKTCYLIWFSGDTDQISNWRFRWLYSLCREWVWWPCFFWHAHRWTVVPSVTYLIFYLCGSLEDTFNILSLVVYSDSVSVLFIYLISFLQ